MSKPFSYGFCALLFLLPVSLAFGQQSGSTLRGTVTSASGSPMGGIELIVTDMAADLEVRDVTSDAHGNFAAPDLPPGTYKLVIQQKGYQVFAAENIVLAPGQDRTVNAKLPANGPEDTAPIQIGANPVDASSGTIRDLVDLERRWNETPAMNTIPSPLPLLVTTPSVQGNGQGLVMAGTSNRNLQNWSTFGVGDETSSVFYGIPNYYEMINVTSANPGPEFARPTGFDLVPKRGGSSFHGNGYFRYETARLDSRPYFSTGKSRYSLDEAGGQAGGTLFKQRTYFFGGWVHQSNPYSVDLFANVPTAQERIRDFSQYLSTSTSPTGSIVVIRDPRNGVPFPGNVIPASRINAVATNAMNNYIPAPTVGGANTFVGNYSWNHPYGSEVYRGNWPFFRIDHRLFDGNMVAINFSETAFTSVAAGSIGEVLDSTQGIKYRTIGVSDTWAMGSRVVNRASVGFSTNYVRQGQGVGNITPGEAETALTNLGIQGTNLNGYTTAGFPTVSVNGITGLSMAYAGGYTNNVAQNDRNYRIEDNLTWSLGKHSLKFGVQGIHYSWLLGTIPQTNWGVFAFSGQFTGVGFADFLLGLPSTSSRLLNPSLNDKLQQTSAGAWVADSFRVTSRLTLDYGVRWDYFGSPTYNDGYMYNWDPTTGRVIVAPGTLTSVSSLYPTKISVTVCNAVPKAKMTNIRPRVSAAYRITDDLVVRGGYGEFTVADGYGANGLINDPDGPFRLVETYTNSISANGVAAYTMPKPFPTTASASLTPTQSITGLPTKADEGVIRQYNLTLERNFHSFLVRGSYVGSRGENMNYSLNINKPQASTTAFSASRLPYPQFNQAWVTRTDGAWHYNSAQAQVERRVGDVTFDSHFTWADNMANYLNTYDPYNVTNKWTRDGSDRKFYFSTSVQWAIPTGKGKRWLANASPMANRVFSNWTLQAIATVSSGQYYSPLFTGPDPSNASAGYVTALPDCVGNPNSGARTIGEWFNPAAFAVPSASAGRYGTCGMNTLEGYPIHVLHASLGKRFQLKEWLTATLAIQVANVFNTSEFTTPNNNISNAGAGAFTATSVVPNYSPEHQGAREVNLKLRLQW